MPSVSVKSLQASSQYLSSVINEHNPSPNCKLLAERVASCIDFMLNNKKFKIPPLSHSNASSKETLDSGLIDVSNPARDNSSNIAKVNITLLEKKLASLSPIVDEIATVEKFFRSYLSSSWTVRTYVTNEQNESRAKMLLQDFDCVVDKVLIELVLGAEVEEVQSWSSLLFQTIVSILNFLLPLFILIFVVLFVGEKFHLFDDVEEFKKLQQFLNGLIARDSTKDL
jgi:hypothetical protein